MDISGNRKGVVIHVPFRLRKRRNLVGSLLEPPSPYQEEVVMIATRRTLPPQKKDSAAQRPRSPTLTPVHEAMLMVYPAEIVWKRIRYRLDGSKIIKILLDPKERNNKLEKFSGVYGKLTGKDVVFEYPVTEA